MIGETRDRRACDLSETFVITLRADADTPANLRRHDGRRSHPIGRDTLLPAPGSAGRFMGIPGYLRYGPDAGMEWVITAPAVDPRKVPEPGFSLADLMPRGDR